MKAMAKVGAQEQSRFQSAFQLPPDIADFTGRTAEIKQILHCYQERTKVVKLRSGNDEQLNHSVIELCAADGRRGLGTSALGIHLAHRLGYNFSDAHLYLDFSRGDNDQAWNPRDILWHWLSLLTEEEYIPNIPRGWYERSLKFQEFLKQENILIVLDNVSDETQVESFLSSEYSPNDQWFHHCLILIISQRPLAIKKSVSWTIESLLEDEAIDLLAKLAGGKRRILGNLAIAHNLIKLCRYLPLPIRMAGRFLKHHPNLSLEEYCQSLETEQSRLKALNYEQWELGAVVSLSYQTMSQQEAEHFLMMGVMPADFNLELMQIALFLEAGDEARSLAATAETWLDMQLLKPLDRGRSEYHALAQDFAGWQLSSEIALATRTKLVDHYCKQSESFRQTLLLERKTQGKLLGQQGQNADELFASAVAWFVVERSNLMTCVNWAFAAQQYAAVVELVTYLAMLCNSTETWLSPVIEALPLAIEAAEDSHDRLVLARIYALLGHGYQRQEYWQQAILYHERALPLLREIEVFDGMTGVLQNLAIAYRESNRWNDAIQACEEAIQKYQSSGEQRGVASTLSILGSVFKAWSRWSDVVECCEQHSKEELSEKTGKNVWTRTCVNKYKRGVIKQFFPSCFSLNEEILGKNNYEDFGAFKQDLLRSYEFAVDEGYTFRSRGRKSRHTWNKAFRCYEESRAIWRQLGEREKEGIALARIGDYWGDRHQFRRAKRYWKKALRKLPHNSAEAKRVRNNSNYIPGFMRGFTSDDKKFVMGFLAITIAIHILMLPMYAWLMMKDWLDLND